MSLYHPRAMFGLNGVSLSRHLGIAGYVIDNDLLNTRDCLAAHVVSTGRLQQCHPGTSEAS